MSKLYQLELPKEVQEIIGDLRISDNGSVYIYWSRPMAIDLYMDNQAITMQSIAGSSFGVIATAIDEEP